MNENYWIIEFKDSDEWFVRVLKSQSMPTESQVNKIYSNIIQDSEEWATEDEDESQTDECEFMVFGPFQKEQISPSEKGENLWVLGWDFEREGYLFPILSNSIPDEIHEITQYAKTILGLKDFVYDETAMGGTLYGPFELVDILCGQTPPGNTPQYYHEVKSHFTEEEQLWTMEIARTAMVDCYLEEDIGLSMDMSSEEMGSLRERLVSELNESSNKEDTFSESEMIAIFEAARVSLITLGYSDIIGNILDISNDWMDRLILKIENFFNNPKEEDRHIDARCPNCGEVNNYLDGGDDHFAICNGCNHSWKFRDDGEEILRCKKCSKIMDSVQYSESDGYCFACSGSEREVRCPECELIVPESDFNSLKNTCIDCESKLLETCPKCKENYVHSDSISGRHQCRLCLHEWEGAS
jgi:uncharacterized Zn ribbon protein